MSYRNTNDNLSVMFLRWLTGLYIFVFVRLYEPETILSCQVYFKCSVESERYSVFTNFTVISSLLLVRVH